MNGKPQRHGDTEETQRIFFNNSHLDFLPFISVFSVIPLCLRVSVVLIYSLAFPSSNTCPTQNGLCIKVNALRSRFDYTFDLVENDSIRSSDVSILQAIVK